VVRRIGWAVVIVVVLVTALVAGAVTVVRVQSSPEVDTASLLLSGDASPRVTDPGRWVAERDAETTMGPGVAHHQITRSWTGPERGLTLGQMVLRARRDPLPHPRLDDGKTPACAETTLEPSGESGDSGC
jgi:hypothetical protein